MNRSSYSDFAAKYGKDERFKGIDKTRERELIFNDFVSELRHKEKEESRTLREKVDNSMGFSINIQDNSSCQLRVELIPCMIYCAIELTRETSTN